MNEFGHALLYIGAAGVVFVAVIVAEALYWKKKGRTDKYNLKDTLSNMTQGVTYKLANAFAVLVFIQVAFDWIYQFGFQYQPSNVLVGAVLIFFITDFTFYCVHFVAHKVRWFWTAHANHHSSQMMNYSTALRQNLTYPLSGAELLWWTPIALVGFDKNWATVAVELNLFYQFFIHTEAPSILDRFGKFMNTPSHHRVHHGSNAKQIDTNFGGVLIIWDKLFGTFQPESEAGEIAYGVTERQPHSYNPIYLQLHEWMTLIRDLFTYKDPRILIMPPNWVEERYKRPAAEPAEAS